MKHGQEAEKQMVGLVVLWGEIVLWGEGSDKRCGAVITVII